MIHLLVTATLAGTRFNLVTGLVAFLIWLFRGWFIDLLSNGSKRR